MDINGEDRRTQARNTKWQILDRKVRWRALPWLLKSSFLDCFFFKENPFCNCLLGVIERMGGERGKQAGLKLWLLCLCFFVFVGLSFVVRCEVDSCSLHATFQSVRVLYLFFSFLIVILLDCFNCILRWLRALGF